MILKKGNMFDSGADVILVTTNAIVRADGCLVMGRGAALEATQRFPGCAKVFGGLVNAHYKLHGWEPYGIIMDGETPDTAMLGIFQVKVHYKDKADLSLIELSIKKLTHTVQHCFSHNRVALNFPGIGNGQLPRSEVLPIISSLPDNVEVYEL